MDLSPLLTRVRDHYIAQFEAFVAKQEGSCAKGAAEVKFEIPDSDLHDQLICVDFAKNDDGVEFVLFSPDLILTFDPVSGSIGRMRFLVEALRWDSAVFHHDAGNLSPAELSAWFERWFDPDDSRHDPSARLGGIIHSLTTGSDQIAVDFGTAEIGAMLDLLDLLERAEATHVRIDSGASESD